MPAWSRCCSDPAAGRAVGSHTGVRSGTCRRSRRRTAAHRDQSRHGQAPVPHRSLGDGRRRLLPERWPRTSSHGRSRRTAANSGAQPGTWPWRGCGEHAKPLRSVLCSLIHASNRRRAVSVWTEVALGYSSSWEPAAADVGGLQLSLRLRAAVPAAHGGRCLDGSRKSCLGSVPAAVPSVKSRLSTDWAEPTAVGGCCPGRIRPQTAPGVMVSVLEAIADPTTSGSGRRRRESCSVQGAAELKFESCSYLFASGLSSSSSQGRTVLPGWRHLRCRRRENNWDRIASAVTRCTFVASTSSRRLTFGQQRGGRHGVLLWGSRGGGRSVTWRSPPARRSRWAGPIRAGRAAGSW